MEVSTPLMGILGQMVMEAFTRPTGISDQMAWVASTRLKPCCPLSLKKKCGSTLPHFQGYTGNWNSARLGLSWLAYANSS